MYDVHPPSKFFQRFEERSFSLSEIKRRAVFSSADGSARSAYSCKVSGSPCPLISAPFCGADNSPEFACKMKLPTDWSQSAANPIVRVILRSREVDGRSLLNFVGFVTGFIAAGSFVRLVLAVSTVLSGSAVYQAATGRTVLIVFRGRSGLVAVSWFRR